MSHDGKPIRTGAVVDAGTAAANKTGSWRSKRPVFDNDKCIACGLCETYCPDGCVAIGEDGSFHPDYEYCKGCGICETVCRSDAIVMEEERK